MKIWSVNDLMGEINTQRHIGLLISKIDFKQRDQFQYIKNILRSQLDRFFSQILTHQRKDTWQDVLKKANLKFCYLRT
jgi:hypothetical protein